MRAARSRENGVTLAQIAKDLGAHKKNHHKGTAIRISTTAQPAWKDRQAPTELREARRRIRLLEQENEVLRRAAAYFSRTNLPASGSTRS